MIPREILKKIRQIELRTYCLVTGFAAGARVCDPQHSRMAYSRNNFKRAMSGEAAAGHRPALRSFQPPPQLRRLSRAIENRNDADVVGLGVKVDAVAMKSPQQSCLARIPAGQAKAFRGFQNFLNDQVDFSLEFITQPRLLFIIPKNRLIKFETGGRREEDVATHAARRAFNRCRASARTCSQGMPAWGFFRNSWARRSNSSFCSGESSSSKSWTTSRIFSKASCCSATGSLQNCLTTSVALMAAIYPRQIRRQAAFPRSSHSALCTPHSEFP